MTKVVKGFVCKEYWTDEEKRKRTKQWGRRYHARSAAEVLADQVRKQVPEDHIVNVCEVIGDERK